MERDTPWHFRLSIEKACFEKKGFGTKKVSTRTGGGATRPLPRDGGVEELHGETTVEPRPNIWRDNPEGELDPAEGVRRRCKKNSPSALSCIGKRIRKGCDRSSVVGTVYSGCDGERPVPLEESEGIWQEREMWERFRLQKE